MHVMLNMITELEAGTRGSWHCNMNAGALIDAGLYEYKPEFAYNLKQ